MKIDPSCTNLKIVIGSISSTKIDVKRDVEPAIDLTSAHKLIRQTVSRLKGSFLETVDKRKMEKKQREQLGLVT